MIDASCAQWEEKNTSTEVTDGGDAPATEVVPQPEAPTTPSTPQISVESSTPEKPAQEQIRQKQNNASGADTVLPPIPSPSKNEALLSKPSNIKRSGSARRSVHGAPQVPLGAGVTIVTQADTREQLQDDDEAQLGQEIVEEVADAQVGVMVNSNAGATAQYLSDVFQRFKARMAELFENGTNEGYSRQYQSMSYIGRDQSIDASQAEGNKLKNRYGNICAYDRTRVHLDVINDDPDTEYINANWIHGYKKENCYIASQGPVPNSFISHWRMVWLQKIETIVMVTHEVEKNRMKCHRYWPDPTSRPPVKTLQYGDIFVTHLTSVPHKHYILRYVFSDTYPSLILLAVHRICRRS